MDRKKEIEILLKELGEIGRSRTQIEEDLNYSPNYIDQTLARGGNERFLNSLKKYRNNVVHEAGIAKGNMVAILDNDPPTANESTLKALKLLEEKYIGELQEKAQLLKEHNLFLQRVIEANLVGISDQQQVLQAEVQAIQQWDAQIAAQGNKAKEAEALGHIQKLTAGNLKRLRKRNKPAEVGK